MSTTTLFSDFKRAFKSEQLKNKGTGLYLIAILLSCIPTVFYFIFTLINYEGSNSQMPFNYFLEFIFDILADFSDFIFPLLIIINVSKIAQLDYKNEGWQLMELQPIRKSSIYFSKYITLLLSNCIAILSFFGSALILTSILAFIHEPTSSAILSIPFSEIGLLCLRLFTASLFLTAFQLLLSVQISSFIWPILIGFFSIIIAQISRNLSFRIWGPIEMLKNVSKYKTGSDIRNWFIYTEKLSFILALFLLAIGYTWFYKKEFKRAFLQNNKTILSSFITIVIVVFLTNFILQPNIYESHSKTIIAGKINSKTTFKKGYIVHPVIRDTVGIFDLTNNSFKYEIQKELPLDTYDIIFDDITREKVVMSNKDSIYLNITFINDDNKKTTITGTRLAENKYTSQNSKEGFYYAKNVLEHNNDYDKPDKFFRTLYEEWEDKYNEANTFNTADNFVPKKDFLLKVQKLVSIECLNYANEFLKNRKALHPNEKTELPKNITSLYNSITLHEETLISDDNYQRYLLHEISKNDTREINPLIKELDAISKLQTSTFKNRLLYAYLMQKIGEFSDKKERETIFITYSPFITDKNLNKNINNYYQIISSLNNGNTAKDFEASTVDGKVIKLSDLKGKFVVIDVWATWCGPCKYSAPYFENMAQKYHTQNIQFITLSVDKEKDKQKWAINVKSKPKTMLHLWSINEKVFSKDYNVSTIPRFIMIDPEGKLYQSDLPRPNQSAFEDIIRDALGLEKL